MIPLGMKKKGQKGQPKNEILKRTHVSLTLFRFYMDKNFGTTLSYHIMTKAMMTISLPLK